MPISGLLMKNSDKSYEDILDELASKRVNQRISNGAPQNAIALLTTMFMYASDHIRIYSGHLDKSVYCDNKLIEAIRNFLLVSKHSVSILVQRPIDQPETHPVLVLAREMADCESHGSLVIRNAEGNYSGAGIEHFTVMDGTGFRYEFDHEKKSAVANFNEPKTAGILASTFDTAFELSDDLVVAL